MWLTASQIFIKANVYCQIKRNWSCKSIIKYIAVWQGCKMRGRVVPSLLEGQIQRHAFQSLELTLLGCITSEQGSLAIREKSSVQ